MNRITDSIYYTGVLNPNMRVFDVIMRTEYGTSYNSYLVLGEEKTAVIEAAHASFLETFQEMLDRSRGDRTIDYLILNHTEPDHTGCVAAFLEAYPDLTVVVSQAGSIYIKQICNRPDLKIQVVKDGDTLDLGGKTLRFINAPFLHWPDSMFTWVEEEKVLFSCDFLGAHFCEPGIVDTRITYSDKYWDAVKYYYDCIFGPFKPHVLNGLEKIKDLDIAYACTSHGPILTKGGNLPRVMELYREWSTPEARTGKQIPIFYCTAYGNTERLAKAVREGIMGVYPDADCGLYNIIEHDMGELAVEMNESDAFLIGALTINREAVPPIWQLLSGIEAVNFAKKPAALFGSYGWSGEAFKNVSERLASAKAKVFEPHFKVCFVPTEEDLQAAREFGSAFARSLS